jgi:acyl carrier protein
MTIKERVIADIREYIKSWCEDTEDDCETTITMETNFFDSYMLDAVLLIELAQELEKKFNIPEIPLEELKAMKSVGQVVEYIEKVVK